MNDEPKNVETYNIRVNITHLEAEGIVRLCEMFPKRFVCARSNGFSLLTIFAVDYKEFMDICTVYAYNLQNGLRFNIVHKPEPTITVHLNGATK